MGALIACRRRGKGKSSIAFILDIYIHIYIYCYGGASTLINSVRKFFYYLKFKFNILFKIYKIIALPLASSVSHIV